MRALRRFGAPVGDNVRPMSSHAAPPLIPPRHPGAPRMPAPARAARPLAATGTAGGVALIVMVVACLLTVLVAANRASFISPPSKAAFPGWMAGPLQGALGAFSASDRTLRWGFSIVLVTMFAAYLVALRDARNINPRWAIAAVAIAHAVLLLAPPLLLTDTFNYLGYGRMGLVQGLNPYLTIPAVSNHYDPSFAFSNWHHLLSPYGPLFTLYTYALALLGLAASFWALKVTLAAASLLILAMLWRCARRLGREPVGVFLFVGANPVVLLWGLGGDHNDFLMMLFIVGAAYLLVAAAAERRRTAGSGPPAPAGADAARAVRPAALAGAALAAAVAIKASAGILAPAMLLGIRARAAFVRGLVLSGAALLALTLVAFGPHSPNLADQTSEVQGLGIPNLVGYFLGQGGLTGALRMVFSVALLAGVAWSARYAWRTGDWITGCAIAMLALLLTLSWELPWYVFWLLPFAALSPRRGLRTVALVLTAFEILVWMPSINDIAKAIHFAPTSTPLGQQHSALTQRLLH